MYNYSKTEREIKDRFVYYIWLAIATKYYTQTFNYEYEKDRLEFAKNTGTVLTQD